MAYLDNDIDRSVGNKIGVDFTDARSSDNTRSDEESWIDKC